MCNTISNRPDDNTCTNYCYLLINWWRNTTYMKPWTIFHTSIFVEFQSVSMPSMTSDHAPCHHVSLLWSSVKYLFILFYDSTMECDLNIAISHIHHALTRCMDRSSQNKSAVIVCHRVNSITVRWVAGRRSITLYAGLTIYISRWQHETSRYTVQILFFLFYYFRKCTHMRRRTQIKHINLRKRNTHFAFPRIARHKRWMDGWSARESKKSLL